MMTTTCLYTRVLEGERITLLRCKTRIRFSDKLTVYFVPSYCVSRIAEKGTAIKTKKERQYTQDHSASTTQI